MGAIGTDDHGGPEAAVHYDAADLGADVDHAVTAQDGPGLDGVLDEAGVEDLARDDPHRAGQSPRDRGAPSRQLEGAHGLPAGRRVVDAHLGQGIEDEGCDAVAAGLVAGEVGAVEEEDSEARVRVQRSERGGGTCRPGTDNHDVPLLDGLLILGHAASSWTDRTWQCPVPRAGGFRAGVPGSTVVRTGPIIPTLEATPLDPERRLGVHMPSTPHGGLLDGDRIDQLLEVVAEVKPKLRGWLHLGTTPLALAAGIVLILLSPTSTTRLGSITFASSAVLLFATSAVYHRGTWSPRRRSLLRRFDYCNIFVMIAGSCTAFSLVLLDGTERVALITIAWVGAAFGIATHLAWPEAPRWISPLVYVVLGWAAVLFAPDFVDGASALGAGTGILVMLAVGGALYTLGALVYGFKRPDPWPTWFGFHEVFHVFTVLAFASHYIGFSLATYSQR